jgi:hypothetical protein
MHLVQILLPRADNSGKAFPAEDFEWLKQELASEFDGVTLYSRAPAEGLWKQGSHVSSDDVVIFEVMTDHLDLVTWRERRAELERKFRQERVIVRHLPMELV